MRVFAAVLLGMSLVASPLLARNAGETGKEDTPVAAASASSVPDKPTAVKPEASAIESEMQDLRSLVEEQRAELESQRAALKAEQLKMKALEEKLGATPSESAATPAETTAAISSATSISSAAGASMTPAATPQQKGNDEVSPLQLRIGSAYITPVGFMDFTGVFRSHNAGGGIGSNFASIPYDFPSSATGINLLNHQTEARLNIQNSRIGFRVDAMVMGAHVIGYMESDFLGNNPGNVSVSSNSNTLRSRLYWVDVQKGKIELLAGQTWSLLTPGRSGISPLPGNLFFSQDIDVNYQAGLFWGRIPELRLVVHPSSKAAIAVALENQEQYVGGSAGGPLITLPTGGTVVNGVSGLPGGQLNNGNSSTNTPQLFPDVIVKLALDPSPKLHFEVGGVERQFVVAVNTTASSASPTIRQSLSGGGAFANLNVQLFKGFRLLTNNYWSQGGGRYIFGQVPDVIIRPDGTLSAIRASSTVSGFEYTYKNTMVYAYYGGIYAFRDVGIVNSAQYGYGVAAVGGNYAAAIAQNRYIQEATFGLNQTLWRDAKYGALNFMAQYSYIIREPWSVAAGNPTNANLDIGFFNLRYTLPGSAPTLGK